MVRRLSFCVFALALTAATAAAAAYDSSWFRADFWGREYPSGFTMTENAAIDIRPEPDPGVASTIPCDLSKNATYHPWNQKRTEERELKFVTFTKVRRYDINRAYRAEVSREGDSTAITIDFKDGDRWEYLTYGSEGFFLMRFNGEHYVAGQDLFEVSTDLDKDAEGANSVDEWLQLTCDNGNVGWLLMRDVEGLPAFGEPNTLDYGSAADKAD